MIYREHAERIVAYVSEVQGCKITQLAMVVGPTLPSGGGAYLLQAVDDLVTTGQLVEVEYILPDLPNTVKSFLLPSGVKVKVVRR